MFVCQTVFGDDEHLHVPSRQQNSATFILRLAICKLDRVAELTNLPTPLLCRNVERSARWTSMPRTASTTFPWKV